MSAGIGGHVAGVRIIHDVSVEIGIAQDLANTVAEVPVPGHADENSEWTQ